MATVRELNERSSGRLPGYLGMETVEAEEGRVVNRLRIREELLAPNGYLHGGTVTALADTACGYGTFTSLPEGATGFTTIELKTNFMGTAREGEIECEAELTHGGRTTQVWDARVTVRLPEREAPESGERKKTIALFRCTQMLLYG